MNSPIKHREAFPLILLPWPVVHSTVLVKEYSKYIYIVYELVLIAVKQLMEVNPLGLYKKWLFGA